VHGDPQISPRLVRLLYSRIYASLLPEDRWHSYSTEVIRSFITRELGDTRPETVVDAGCGDIRYIANCGRLINIDLIPIHSTSGCFGIVANLVELPVVSGIADVAICVGSVLNYVDALPALTELRRVLKADGRLMLEFETSSSLEFLQTKTFDASIAPVVRTYKGFAHRICLYSVGYMLDVLRECGFHVVRVQRFHIVSSLIYRLTRNLNIAGLLARAGDLVLHNCKSIALGSNIVLSCMCR
jgi:SAM-dependent methyltransferase